MTAPIEFVVDVIPIGVPTMTYNAALSKLGTFPATLVLVSDAAAYVMGHNDRQRRRLILQASLLNPFTEQLFRRAGISSAMNVLDIGCGGRLPGDRPRGRVRYRCAGTATARRKCVLQQLHSSPGIDWSLRSPLHIIRSSNSALEFFIAAAIVPSLDNPSRTFSFRITDCKGAGSSTNCYSSCPPVLVTTLARGARLRRLRRIG